VSRERAVRIDVSSCVGLPLAIALILVGQWFEGGSVLSLLQPTAAMIVFGGTVGAVMLSFSRNEVLRAFGALRTVFLWNGEPPSKTIETILRYAHRARKDGILSLDADLDTIADPFFEKAIRQLVEVLEIDSRGREDYDEIPAKVYEAAGGYAPTIGILGAVIGLIQVMQHLSDPTKLGEGIAVAFVATVYGVGSANLFFLPVATKLRMKARYEAMRRELMLEGVLAIQDGMFPRIIQEKLYGFTAQAAPPQEKPHRA
jgi:chemotaxis protein MotA